MLLDHEIAEVRSVEHLDREVLSPSGNYVKITHVCKTIPLPVWRIATQDFELKCSAKHLVISLADGPTEVDQLKVGQFIFTKEGYQKITEIEDLEETRELYDLRVDSDDHLYITDGIASHNSTGLCGAELFKFNIIPNYRNIYITPLQEQLKTIADKMMDMQRGSAYPPKYYLGKGYRNNMYYKESPRGGSIKLIHILTDPSKIRGNSAQSVVIDESQDFDPEHLPEIEQVQRAFPHSRTTMFAGTSKDLDTCLEAQYRFGSMAEWHIPCTCKDKFHSLADSTIIEGMLSVDGMRCPNNYSHRLNPLHGFFVHMQQSKLNLNMPSFHLPQVIVPEYASGPGYMQIYKDFKRYSFTKFLQEVWGIAVASGKTEISERDLKACCTDFTFEQTQERFFKKKQRYVYIISGVDWGGSDWEPAYRSKLSFTVHTIWGMKGDGTMDLLYAHRYEAMNYQDIAGTIVEKHNEFEGFAMGTDNGGGAYYNAYMRDCGRIPTNRIIHFQYTDTQLLLDRIKHPEAHIMSLHRTDSISALYADLKGGKITWPRWDEVAGFALDFLNTRRNITETPAGRTILRFIKHGAKADDFMMSTNYAVMMKRIINREPFIPNQQIMDEIRTMFGIAVPNQIQSGLDDLMGGGYVSG